MTEIESTKKKSFIDIAQPFAVGGFAGCIAISIIQPIDMIKVTIQLKSQELSVAKKAGKTLDINISPLSTIRELYSEGGIRKFYKGLDSALTRQVFYATTRLGVYKTIFEQVKSRNAKEGRKDLSFAQKAFCASIGGFVGSLVGNPADLALVRMQADSRLPVQQRRNYTNVFNAFSRIVKDEGVMALWRGATTTITRAIALNLVMLASYDEIKERIIKTFNKKDDIQVRVVASAVSGILSSIAALPFDNSKTKIQKMTKNADGTFPYKNIFDAMIKTIVNQGVFKLWVGLPTFMFRIAPHACITLLSQDIITDYVKKLRAANKD